jgi:adenylate kinase
VVELKVDEAALLARIETRVQETLARGEAVRADDNAETLGKRLEAWRIQTAPVSAYYAGRGQLRVVDGMLPVHQVSTAIDAAILG